MRLILACSIGLFITTTIGCSSADLDPSIRINRVADRQLAPEPVYNRLRWVHLPEMYPARQLEANENRPRLFPVFHFTVKDASYCDAASVLAGTARYSLYCSSLLGKEKITLDALGTVDELAQLIEEQGRARVVVDHLHREVRFLLNTKVDERFFEGGEEIHEH